MKIIYILSIVSILHSCGSEKINIKNEDFTSKEECEKSSAAARELYRDSDYLRTDCMPVEVKP